MATDGDRWRRDARLARGERRILAAVRDALAALAGYAQSALAQSGLDPAVLDDRAPAWRDALTGQVNPAIMSVFTDAWQLIDHGTGIDPTPYGTRHLESVWNRLVGSSDEVFDRIRTVLEAGRQEGLHPNQMAREVDALLADTANWEGRARTIARTEVIGANNAGARASARATAEYLGYSAGEVQRSWMATSDSRTRPSHADADGMTIMGLDSLYDLDGGSLNGPGDPGGSAEEVVNCRCTETFLYPGDPGYDDSLTAGGAMTAADTEPEDAEQPPVIVCALPSDTDAVQDIGDEQKHATLAYLGPVEGVDVAAVRDAVETWLQLADTAPHTPEGGTEDVTGVETLGDGGARVWMIDPGGVLSNLRDGLLGLEPIGDLDAANNEHPDFTPHVTIGYALTDDPEPVPADALDESTETAAAAIKRITFDRLAVWAGTEQTEYPLTGPASDDTQETPVPEPTATAAAGTTLLATRRQGKTAETLAQTADRLVASGFFPSRQHVARHLLRSLNQPLARTAAAGDPAPVPVEPDTAAVGDPAPAVMPDPYEDFGPNPDRFHGICVVEDEQTGDGRVFAPGSIYWDDAGLPMPFAVQFQDMPGHDGALITGRLDTFERMGNAIWYTGTWDLEGMGWEARRLVQGQFLRGISVDTDDLDVLVVNPDGTPYDGFDMFMPVEDDAPDPILLVERSRLRSATGCRVPAFAPSGTTGAFIANGLPEDLQAAVDAGVEAPPAPADDVAVAALVASAVAYDEATATTALPPGSWFSDPGLGTPTPVTITDEGRVFGHLAAWGTCHIGVQGSCITPPRSQTDYAHFAHGVTPTADGPVITGLLTMDTGHAEADLRALPAAAHYDNTGTQFATVAVGEDDIGIWVAGALTPDATAEQVARVNRAGALSGDWRKIRGNLELVAALAVNTPGFPLPRLSLAASAVEGQTSLVAAGIVTRDTAAAVGLADGTLTMADVRAMVASALADERASEARRGRIEQASARLRRSRATAAAARIGG